MTELEELRNRAKTTGEEMEVLFEKIMGNVQKIAEYKGKRGLPVEDEIRDREVIAEAAKLIDDEVLREYYTDFVTNIMKISKRYEHRLLSGLKTAYSGVPGAFAEIVSHSIFPESETVGYGNFALAYNACERGECDNVVLPIENSINGDVGQVMDLAFFGPLYINQMQDFEVVQNLLAVPGARLSDIDTVISHPQALGQCTEFIKKYNLKQVEAVNTAVAAENVAKMGKKNVAAIGSAEAAEKYGLVKLESHINDESGNTTRFAVFSKTSKEVDPRDNRFVMTFTVDNKAGMLGSAINVFGRHGINLVSLKSRPTKKLSWNYYFFVEGEGNVYSENYKRMVEELRTCCMQVRVLGSYRKETI